MKLPALAAMAFLCCAAAQAHSNYTPEPGSEQRKAIMNVARAGLYAANPDLKSGDKVLFVVHYLMVDSGWACLNATPTQDGKPVAEPGWWLLELVDGKWTNKNYFERLQPYADDAAGDDALNMGAATIAKLRKLFPDCPDTVFPPRN